MSWVFPPLGKAFLDIIPGDKRKAPGWEFQGPILEAGGLPRGRGLASFKPCSGGGRPLTHPGTERPFGKPGLDASDHHIGLGLVSGTLFVEQLVHLLLTASDPVALVAVAIGDLGLPRFDSAIALFGSGLLLGDLVSLRGLARLRLPASEEAPAKAGLGSDVREFVDFLAFAIIIERLIVPLLCAVRNLLPDPFRFLLVFGRIADDALECRQDFLQEFLAIFALLGLEFGDDQQFFLDAKRLRTHFSILSLGALPTPRPSLRCLRLIDVVGLVQEECGAKVDNS